MKKLALVTFAIVGLSSLLVFAESKQPTAQIMSDAEILQTVSGNTTIGTFSDRALSYIVYVAPDGELIAKLLDGKSERIERGAWRVQNNRLIGKWNNLKDGTENSFEYRVVGSNVHAYREDGTLDRVQFFVSGDPFDLQNASTEVDDQAAVKARVAEWMTLWNPGQSPINAARFDNHSAVFAEGDQYLAVDDFTGEVLVLRSYAEYAATWEPVMSAFERWNIELVGDIDVDLSGDTAVTFFKFKGDGVLTDGSTVTGYTYSTLVWRKIDGNWRLIHEHLTGASA